MPSVAAVRASRSCITATVTTSRAMSGAPTPLLASCATTSVLPSATSRRDCTCSSGTDVVPTITADPTWLGPVPQPLTTTPTVATTARARPTCLYTTTPSHGGSSSRVAGGRHRRCTPSPVGCSPDAGLVRSALPCVVDPAPSVPPRGAGSSTRAAPRRTSGNARVPRGGARGGAADRVRSAAPPPRARPSRGSEFAQVDQPVLQRPRHQRRLRRGRAADVRVLDPDPGDVGVDRLHREPEPGGHQVLRVALEPREQHLPLAVTQHRPVGAPVARHHPAERRRDVGQVP